MNTTAQDLSTARRPPTAETGSVPVWDVLVRVAHWGLVAAFFTAYLTEGEPLTVHVWAGYALAGILGVRILWGFVGSRHARFRDFAYPPRAVLGYLRDSLRRRSHRYLGHSPAGGAMVFTLLLTLLLATVSGLGVYALEESAGPLVGLVAERAPSAASPTTTRREGNRREPERRLLGADEDFWEEAHELLANLGLLLVILHVGGVAVASFAHRENLVKAMVTGRKRPSEH